MQLHKLYLKYNRPFGQPDIVTPVSVIKILSEHKTNGKIYIKTVEIKISAFSS